MLIDMICPHCGAQTQMDEETQSIICPYCGSHFQNIAEHNGNEKEGLNHKSNLTISFSSASSSSGMSVHIVETN